MCNCILSFQMHLKPIRFNYMQVPATYPLLNDAKHNKLYLNFEDGIIQDYGLKRVFMEFKSPYHQTVPAIIIR